MTGRQARLAAALVVAFTAYGAWAALTSAMISAVYGVDCRQQYFRIACDFSNDAVAASASYPAMLALLLAAVAAVHWRWRSASAYPFLMLSAALCGGALAWDMAASQPVLLAPKIINDTINILGTVIAASFTLLVILCRRTDFPLGSFALAVLASYTLTLVSVIAFVELSSSVFGVTELFLLYVIYAFGSFTVHLMTVCGFVAKLRDTEVPA